jgi:hypothetical protein
MTTETALVKVDPQRFACELSVATMTPEVKMPATKKRTNKIT